MQATTYNEVSLCMHVHIVERCKKMWKLKIAEGGPWLMSVNNHAGRQHWVFDTDAGTSEELAEVERLRQNFKENRFRFKQSSDLFMRMQVIM